MILAMGWAHAGPTLLASFLASLVECVEALTVILAVGSVRGWRGALTGSAAAIVVLLAIVATLGRELARIPLHIVQLAVGALLLLFGLRWLRKAVLRAAGVIPLRDEQTAFAKSTDAIERSGGTRSRNRLAFAACFQITMLEGAEVVFIVIAVSAGGAGLLLPAGVGAIVALVLVTALGFAARRPLATVPENKLKFVVGVLLSAFGTFWVGEGMGIRWPGADWAIAGLLGAFLAVAFAAIPLCRRQAAFPGTVVHP